MGIKNFFKLVNKNDESKDHEKIAAEMGTEVKLVEFKGQRLCMDASYTIYSSMLAMQHITTLTDANGKSTAHINTIFQKVLLYKKFNVDVIWIFDSPTQNDMKKEENTKRKAQKKKSNNEKAKFQMTSEHVHDITSLLSLMGVFYIIAPDGIEAEQYGAKLTAGPEDERCCKYMISGDSDVLFFGGNLLRPMKKKSASGKSSKTVYATYDLQYLLDEFDVTMKEFVEMGLTLGCDFAKKTPRIGPKTVHNKLIAGKLPDLTEEQKKAFTYFTSDIESDAADLVQNVFDRTKLLNMLVGRGFNRETTAKKIDAVYK